MKSEKMFTQAEYSIVKQYKVEVAEQKNRQLIRIRDLEVEEVELSKNIRTAVRKFDKKLRRLYKLKLEIEKCIISEELKICVLIKQIGLYRQVEKQHRKIT